MGTQQASSLPYRPVTVYIPNERKSRSRRPRLYTDEEVELRVAAEHARDEAEQAWEQERHAREQAEQERQARQQLEEQRDSAWARADRLAALLAAHGIAPDSA